MQESMGQIVKRLRKEHNFTQEELAEQIGVTFQAVSKWENDSGLPDISQIVPLATVLGVSTDVLFGMPGTDYEKEVHDLILEAGAYLTTSADKENLRQYYHALAEGLKKYPNSIALLVNCLEAGLALSYPGNDTYDQESGEQIYRECICQADRIIRYGKNQGDILRAHMIMVLLHSAYGNVEAAKEHATAFPVRSDMTWHNMEAYLSHAEKDFHEECICRQYDLMNHIEALLDTMAALGSCYYEMGKYEDAEETWKDAIKIIDVVCEREKVMPTMHDREKGDFYALLAEADLKNGDRKGALQKLKKMADHDLHVRANYEENRKLHTPLLRDTEHVYFRKVPNIRQHLLKKLQAPAFSELKDVPEFMELIKKAS